MGSTVSSRRETLPHNPVPAGVMAPAEAWWRLVATTWRA